jgi:hypothetical protein
MRDDLHGQKAGQIAFVKDDSASYDHDVSDRSFYPLLTPAQVRQWCADADLTCDLRLHFFLPPHLLTLLSSSWSTVSCARPIVCSTALAWVPGREISVTGRRRRQRHD